MGELKNKRIVQSRAYLDDSMQQPIPPYDYDYTYPVTVYEAVKRSMDDTSTNLEEELASIYRMINDKQNIVDPGIPGQLMTWTGIRGNIGSMEVTKSINPESSLRSHRKVPSERAIGDALDSKVSKNDYASHTNDTSIHTSDIERQRWNSMAPLSQLQAHIANIGAHITEAERGNWNGKANQSDFEEHIYNINNPHNVTAHQTGTYTRREIDEMFENLRETFFNYLNISWDDRTQIAELVPYNPANWNPNYVLAYGEDFPTVPDDSLTYFALRPATEYQTNETQDCIIYAKRPTLAWQEVGFRTMNPGDMLIKFPDTNMYVWVQGHFIKLFTGNTNAELPQGGSNTSDLMWRPSLNDKGELVWTKSTETDPPGPMIIKGEDGYTPIKGVDYNDGVDGQGVPIGGNAGEVLVKMTDNNFETTWKNLADILGDLIISGGDLPDGIISWEKISGRPEWYNELGDNEDGFITQKAATRQFEILSNNIANILEKIDGPTGIEGIKQDLFDHMNDFNNPHRVTPAIIGAVSTATFTDHVQNFDNPHNVTAQQIGLGNVNNTSDMDKPISNAVREALDNLIDQLGGVSDNIERFNYVSSVSWNDSEVSLTFFYKDETELKVILPVKEIFNNIYFDDSERELVIVMPDGDENRINIGSLIKSYSGCSSDNIQVEVQNGDIIKATILPSSVGELEIAPSVHLRMSPTTTTQPVSDRSTRIATTEFTRSIVIDNLISYETDRPLSANMGRILNERKADIEDVIQIINDIEGVSVIDNLDSTSVVAALSANMGRYLDLTKAPRVHTSPSGATFGRATISLFGHARASDIDPLMDGTVFRGTDDGYFARADHRHPTDTTRAPLHWPDVAHDQYQFSGEPRTTLPPDDSNDNRIASTEWIRRNAVGCMYGKCQTPGSESIKIATLESSFMDDPVFLRQIGSTVAITFAEDDRATSDVYLNVHGSGAALVTYGGSPIINGMIKANYTYSFTFDGTNWCLKNPSGIHTLPDDDYSPSLVSSEWVRRNIVGVFKGYCRTSKGNANKVATLKSTYMDPVVFIRQIGIAVAITFDQEDRSGDTVTTLNVNDSGAAEIIFAGTKIVNGMIGKNHTHLFIFDGTYWRLINPVPGTGMAIGGGLIIGPGGVDPEDPVDPDTPEQVINQLAGHNGITCQGNSGGIDGNGQVNRVWTTINFSPKSTDVTMEFSDVDGAFAFKMGDGSLIKANSPTIVSITRSNAVVEFALDGWYPSNSPCQLVYRTNKAWYKVIEI